MKRSSVPWYLILVLGTLALLLSACQSAAPAAAKPTSAPASQPASSAPQAAPTTAPSGAASGQAVKLRFPSWQWGQPGYDEFYTAAIAEFQKTHPNVTIEKIPVESSVYADQLVKMFAANDPPEIVQYLTALFYKAVDAGWLDPMDDRLQKTDIPKSWAPYLLDAGRPGGKSYGVWVSGSPYAMMYNKKMFQEANVQVPKTPDEFLAASKALTKKGPDGNVSQFGYSLTTKMDNNAYIYGTQQFVIGMGGSWGKDGKPTAADPLNKKGIELERDMIKAGVVPMGADRIQAREIFWQGKAAMILEGPWVMTSVRSENPKLLPDVGVTLIPFPKQVSGSSNGFAIAKNQKQKELAWEFIQMVTSEEWMKKFGEMAGVTPARQGALSQKALQNAPWLSAFADVEKQGVGTVTPGMEGYYNDIAKIVSNRVSDVFFGNKSSDQALSEIQADMEKMLKQ